MQQSFILGTGRKQAEGRVLAEHDWQTKLDHERGEEGKRKEERAV